MVLHFAKATGIYIKTMPFVLVRMGIGLFLGIASIAYFGVIGWLAYTFVDAGTVSGWVAIVGLLIAFVLFVKAWRLFVRYALYLVKAGHIAVIAHIVQTGATPSNQLSYGTGQVKEHFTEASALFAVDMVVKSVIKQFNRRVLSVSNLVSFVPNLKQLIEFVGRAVAIAASYIDEAIIAYMFLSEEENRWRAASDGLVLYAKSWKPVLMSTMLIVVGLYGATIALFLAFTPLAGILSGFSTGFELAGWIVIGGLLVTIYTGLLKPWVKTVVITTFLIESRDESPDTKTRQYIEERSAKFRELLEEADTEERNRERGVPEADEPATPA